MNCFSLPSDLTFTNTTTMTLSHTRAMRTYAHTHTHKHVPCINTITQSVGYTEPLSYMPMDISYICECRCFLICRASGDCAFDSVFVMVKANHTRRASELVSKLIAPRSSSTASSLPLPTVISLQNGMGNRAVLTEVLGDQARVARGVIDMGARIVSPGVVHSSLKGATTLVLKPEHGDLAPQLLQSSQLNVSLLHDETLLEPILWGKLLVNCAINPVTCLLDQQNGQVLHQPEMMALVDEIVDEVLTVMKHKDIQPPWQRSPHEQVRSVLRATATNVSSMLADVRRGVLTEINFINSKSWNGQYNTSVLATYSMFHVWLMVSNLVLMHNQEMHCRIKHSSQQSFCSSTQLVSKVFLETNPCWT
eukprot:m.101737 g.101737  ORF g.101737 m.101737 type:complete len:364 (-) comp13208_c0_seq6:1591-2682(-)